MGKDDSLGVDYQYLVTGVNALSRAHRVKPMAGHLGAAVIAGYFIGEQQPGLDPIVFAGIESELDRIILGESVFSPQAGAAITVSEMFAPYEKEMGHKESIDAIAQALSRNIDETHESGHNVIFASIAIRALKDHPEFAAPSIVKGFSQLISNFDGTTPGSGYYGIERGRIDGSLVQPAMDQAFPPYAGLHSMVNGVFDELILRAAEKRQGYGGLVHIINHAAALCELARYGYQQLAIEGLRAHHQHVQLWRTLPNVEAEFGPETPVENAPWSPEYWRSGKLRPGNARLTHRIKTIYGFNVLADFCDDQTKTRQAKDMLRYLL